MTYLTPPPEAVALLGALAEAVGGTLSHVNLIRVCDHCGAEDGARKSGGGEHWVFPYSVTGPDGRCWQHLCNPCFDLLGIVIVYDDDA